MVTVPAGFVIELNTGGAGTPAVGIRRAMAVLFRQTTPGVAESGRLGVDHFAVTGQSGAMKYNVSAGGLLITRDATGGVYLIGMPESVEIDTDPVDGVNPRIDVIYARQPDPALDGEGTAVDFVIDVAVGVPAANPQPKALPDGALTLARKQIAANATNTASGLAFTNVAPVTGLNFGGILQIGQGGTGSNSKAGARAAMGFSSGPTVPANTVGDDGDWFAKVL